jgi:phosphonatase-like hydrolase
VAPIDRHDGIRIALVVFDLAGTTIEDDDAVNEALRVALRSAAVEAERDEVNRVMGLAKPEAVARILTARRGTAPDAEEVRAVHDAFVLAMLAHYRGEGGVRPFQGVEATFEALHAAGTRIAIDTGFPRAIAEAVLARTRWLERGAVDLLVASDDVPRGRPHPDMIHAAMRALGIEDARAVAKVGDTPSDLAEGRRAECGLTVGVTYGTHTRAELAACPHDVLVDTQDELRDALGCARGAPSRATCRSTPSGLAWRAGPRPSPTRRGAAAARGARGRAR